MTRTDHGPSSHAATPTPQSHALPLPCVRIYYSTQSGRAKACARRTARLLSDQDGNSVRLCHAPMALDDDPDLMVRMMQSSQQKEQPSHDCRPTAATDDLYIFLIATTGDGQHTDTIQRTWRQLLSKSLSHDALRGVHAAVFGLGDRAYGPLFCAASRKFTVRLCQLGATIVGERGYGDDGTPNGGVWRDLDAWMAGTLQPWVEQQQQQQQQRKSVWTRNHPSHGTTTMEQSLKDAAPPYHVTVKTPLPLPYPVDNNTEDTSSTQDMSELDRYKPYYRAFFQSRAPRTAYRYTENGRRILTESDDLINNDNNDPLVGHVVENRRLTADDWEQDTRHIRLRVATAHATTTKTATTTTTSIAQSDLNNSDDDDDWNPDALPYRAGDVASVLPCHSADEVNAFLAVLPPHLQALADHPLTIVTTPPLSQEYNNDTGNDQTTASTKIYLGHGYRHWPEHCTLRGWLTYCADVAALPEREDLRALAAYCGSSSSSTAAAQRDKLLALSEPSASALYVDYVVREKRRWRHVLYDFDTLRAEDSTMTLEALLGLLPPVRTRDFSIASAPTEDQRQRMRATPLLSDSTITRTTTATSSTTIGSPSGFGVDLCVAVVQGQTRLGRSYHGLCSHFLAGCPVGAQFLLWIRPGSFHGLPLELAAVPNRADDNDNTTVTVASVPSRMAVPLLCVGAGTGVAPLRGLIRERQAVLEQGQSGRLGDRGEEGTIGNGGALDTPSGSRDNILVFGCRKESADFYYRKEWSQLQASGQLELLTAFSRDQWHKIYVQQILDAADQGDAKLIVDHILKRSGAVYIAGGPKMAKDVKETIVEALALELNGDTPKAVRLLEKLRRLGRYSVEAWS